jgi:hypothetical protein
MLKRFNNFIKENKGTVDLLYYAFDWDDNILYMPTKIHMDKLVDGEWIPEDVSTSKFAEIRADKENWRIRNNDPIEAFSEFRDFGKRGDSAFLEDTKDAIKNKKYGPSWEDFIECLSNASLFSIITARGHESPSMRKAVEWIIDNYLSEDDLFLMYSNLLKFAFLYEKDLEPERILRGTPSDNILVKKYLDECEFVGVSAPSRGGSPDNPEKAKEDALLGFKEKINRLAGKIGANAMIGFSDDDLGNVKHIENLIDNIHRERFPNIVKYVVKGTKYPQDITKKVRDFQDNYNESSMQAAPGMQASVMPFTQFNNLTNRVNNTDIHNRQDPYYNRTKREVEFVSKNSKEILKDMEDIDKNEKPTNRLKKKRK